MPARHTRWLANVCSSSARAWRYGCTSARYSMRTLLFIIALSAAGQNLSVGFIGGASPTSDFQNQISPSGNNFPGFLNYSTPKHYIFGASLEYRLTPHFSIEADGLYHPLGYTFAGIEPGGSLNSISPATVVTWEFPVLAKYRFAFHRVSPFVEAGPSFRTTGNLNSANPSHAGSRTSRLLRIRPKSGNSNVRKPFRSCA